MRKIVPVYQCTATAQPPQHQPGRKKQQRTAQNIGKLVPAPAHNAYGQKDHARQPRRPRKNAHKRQNACKRCRIGRRDHSQNRQQNPLFRAAAQLNAEPRSGEA